MEKAFIKMIDVFVKEMRKRKKLYSGIRFILLNWIIKKLFDNFTSLLHY